MNEEGNQSVATDEVVEAAAPATDSETVQERKDTQAQQRKKNDVEHNWAEARRKMQELERQNRELAERVNVMQKPQVAEDDGLSSLAKDDIITVEQAQKLAAKMARQAAEQAIRQHAASTVDERLQAKFSDFAEVVSPDNIEQLKQTDPELAESLYELRNDPYKQGVAAYKLLKRLDIGRPEPESMERKKAIENSQKPVSVNAVTKQASAIGNAHLFENGLTKELKTQLYKEMRDCAKRA